VGELRGTFLVDWLTTEGAELGEASVLVGPVTGLDFRFATAGADLGLQDDSDPLAGHTAHYRGVATRGEERAPFEVVLLQDEDHLVTGVPLTLLVSQREPARVGLGLRLTTDDGVTLFDGVDFDTLPIVGGIARIVPGCPAHNRVRNAMQRHEHYVAQPLR
jgi:hypothetical protein